MAVAAKLSKLFYDRFGEEIVNELVELLNQVLAQSRADLQEFNETNFARFDAKLDQRVAELRAEMRILKADLEKQIASGLAGQSLALEKAVSGLRVAMEKTVSEQRVALEQAVSAQKLGLEGQHVVLEKALSGQNVMLEKALKEQARWFVGAWGILLASIVALWFR